MLARRRLLRGTSHVSRGDLIINLNSNSSFLLRKHMLSLPMFALMPRSVYQGFVGLSRPSGHEGTSSRAYVILAVNMLTQLICVSGVNQLSSVCTYEGPSSPLFTVTRSLEPYNSLPFSLMQDCRRQRGHTHRYTAAIFFTIYFFCCCLIYHSPPFFRLFVESVRGINPSRTHCTQSDQLVF